MESDLQQQHRFLHTHNQHQQIHQKPLNSGLMRYQSAPSSYFSSILDRDFCEDFFNRPPSPETEPIFARFLSSSGGNTEIIKQDSPVREAVSQVNQQPQVMDSVNIGNSNTNSDTRLHQRQLQLSHHSASQSFYQSQSKPPLPDQKPVFDMDYRSMNSMGMERVPPMKTGGGNNSNLIRHNSSPAGLFSNINIEFENGKLFC